MNRAGPTPLCNCETKQSIIAAAVSVSIFLFCGLLTVFVIIRRRAALKHSRAQSMSLSAEWNNSYIPPGTMDGAPRSWTSSTSSAAAAQSGINNSDGFNGTSAQQQHDGYNQLRS